MRNIEMVVYFLLASNCATLCYYQQDIFYAVLAGFFVALPTIALLRRFGAWLWVFEDKENNKPL